MRENLSPALFKMRAYQLGRSCSLYNAHTCNMQCIERQVMKDGMIHERRMNIQFTAEEGDYLIFHKSYWNSFAKLNTEEEQPVDIQSESDSQCTKKCHRKASRKLPAK